MDFHQLLEIARHMINHVPAGANVCHVVADQSFVLTYLDTMGAKVCFIVMHLRRVLVYSVSMGEGSVPMDETQFGMASLAVISPRLTVAAHHGYRKAQIDCCHHHLCHDFGLVAIGQDLSMAHLFGENA